MLGSLQRDLENTMPKLKSHKALLKRVKITGRGKVKFHKANAGHLMSGKTADKKRKLHQSSYAKAGDIPRLKRLLHRPLLAADRDVRKIRDTEE